MIDKGALEDLLKESRKRLPRAQVAMLRADVETLAERTFSQRVSSKASKEASS